MSIEMSNLAWETKVKSSVMKCLLMALADHHNKDTGQCNPSLRRLAERTCMKKQTVVNNINNLIDAGLISKVKDPGDGGGRRSNNYILYL